MIIAPLFKAAPKLQRSSSQDRELEIQKQRENFHDGFTLQMLAKTGAGLTCRDSFTGAHTCSLPGCTLVGS